MKASHTMIRSGEHLVKRVALVQEKVAYADHDAQHGVNGFGGGASIQTPRRHTLKNEDGAGADLALLQREVLVIGEYRAQMQQDVGEACMRVTLKGWRHGNVADPVAVQVQRGIDEIGLLQGETEGSARHLKRPLELGRAVLGFVCLL